MPTSQPNEDAAAKLAKVRQVLAAFDWERGDHQYALGAIDVVVSGSED